MAFWLTIGPFLLDDPGVPGLFGERGRSISVPCELTPALRLSDELRFSTSRNAIAHDDPAINPHAGLWFAVHPSFGAWRVIWP